MEYNARKNGLVALTCISLMLNVIAGLLLYQNSQTEPDTHEKKLIKQIPLDYDSFRDQWGKAWLGLEVTDVTVEIATRLGLDRADGAYVQAVAVGSPAQKADIAPGNVILSFNGRKIRTAKQFQNDMLGSRVGEEVYMCVAKEGYRITIYALPEERVTSVTREFAWLGVEVIEVLFGSNDAQKLEDIGKAGGVLIESVADNSPADKGGIQVGDIIMSFNSRKTRTLMEFLKDLAGFEPGDQVAMCIMRDDIRITIYVTLEKIPSFLSI